MEDDLSPGFSDSFLGWLFIPVRYPGAHSRAGVCRDWDLSSSFDMEQRGDEVPCPLLAPLLGYSVLQGLRWTWLR